MSLSIISRVIGDEQVYSLQNRIYNAALLISLFTVLVSLVWNNTVGILAELNLFIIGTALFFLILYGFSILLNRQFHLAYVIVSLSSLSIYWISTGGIDGSTPYIFLLAVVLFAAISKKREYILYLIISLIYISILSYLQFSDLEIIYASYPSEDARHSDMLFSLIFCIFAGVWLIITFRKHYLQEKIIIENQKSELEKINASKDKFFSIISHDLKSPFHGLLGVSGLMTSPEMKQNPELLQKMAIQLNQSIESTNELIENLLSWSKMQRTSFAVRIDTLNLNAFIQEQQQSYLPLVQHKSIQFDQYTASSIRILADPELLKVILRNLLSNAVKFTPEGGKIAIRAEIIDSSFVGVHISDTGIGMSKKQVELLFKEDYHSGTQGLNGESSSGLGLILCKEFVELMGGSIQVESEPGKGSRFTFQLRQAN